MGLRSDTIERYDAPVAELAQGTGLQTRSCGFESHPALKLNMEEWQSLAMQRIANP